ncbi:hypothetical protein ACJ41O_006211 [Fusarium nematophilum]
MSIAATARVKVHVSATRSLVDKEGHRRWLVDINQTLPDRVEPVSIAKDLKLLDPFVLADYHQYEKIKRERAHRRRLNGRHRFDGANSTPNPATDTEQWSQPESKLERYRQELHKALGLDVVLQHGCTVKISIIEKLHLEGQDGEPCYSIHSLLWELLENCRDGDIHVTRWITGIRKPSNLPPSLCRAEEPIRLLLVVARDFSESRDGRFSDPPSVVYDTLYAIAKYLRTKGRHRRLSIDVVRPGTLGELKNHFKRERQYDMVHFDMHGSVESSDGLSSDGTPMLCFGQAYGYTPTNARPDSSMLYYAETRDVAKLLKDHCITAVVLSACLSSFGQGRPLSNMCQVFASFGICAVTGMNFSVDARTAEDYYSGFYPALVLANLSFRNAAIYGRRTLNSKLQERSRKKRRSPSAGSRSNNTVNSTAASSSAVTKDRQTYQDEDWPAATTYFATGDLYRINSMGFMGETPDSIATDPGPRRSWPLSLLCCVLLYALSIFTTYKSLWGGETLEEADLSQDFTTFRTGLGRDRVVHSVGLMVLEDRLKSLKQLFIHVNPPVRDRHLQDLKDQWLVTNFVDRVEIIPASRFRDRWLPVFLLHLVRYKLSRCYADAWSCWEGQERSTTRHEECDPARRSVLVITGLESIMANGKPRYQAVVDRMDAYIQAVQARHPSGLYLIFTSQKEVGWLKALLDPGRYPWIKAQPFVASSAFSSIWPKT